MSNAPAAQPVSSDQKLKQALQPMLDRMVNELEERLSAQLSELMIQSKTIVARMDVLEQNIAKQRKPVGTKTRPTATDGTAGTGATGGTVGHVFPASKASYFKQKYKENDATWVAKYVPAAVVAIMKDDKDINSRNGDNKLAFEASYVLNWLKSNDKALFDAVGADFLAEKKAHEAAQKPAPQVAEPAVTP